MHGLPYNPQLSPLTSGRAHKYLFYLQVLDEHLVVYSGVWWCTVVCSVNEAHASIFDQDVQGNDKIKKN